MKALGKGKSCLEAPRSAAALIFLRNLISWTKETLLIMTSPTNPLHQDQGPLQGVPPEPRLDQALSYHEISKGNRVSWVQGIRFLLILGLQYSWEPPDTFSLCPKLSCRNFLHKIFCFTEFFCCAEISCRKFL